MGRESASLCYCCHGPGLYAPLVNKGVPTNALSDGVDAQRRSPTVTRYAPHPVSWRSRVDPGTTRRAEPTTGKRAQTRCCPKDVRARPPRRTRPAGRQAGHSRRTVQQVCKVRQFGCGTSSLRSHAACSNAPMLCSDPPPSCVLCVLHQELNLEPTQLALDTIYYHVKKP
jgi:hypothetical protein